ncbi:MAG: chemotaxis protein CheA [Sulfuricurvum sp.]|nr:chemotaxis protein CheA [Sulfuricurvum sp.]
MAAIFDINKYRQMFLEEAEELFETIDTILLEAENSGDMDNETVNCLFRSVHTLKGNSASVELTMFAALAHELEFFMDRLRNGELKFEIKMADLLIEGIDTLKQILDMELLDTLDEDYFHIMKADILNKISLFSEDSEEIFILNESEEKSSDFGLLSPQDDEGDFGLFGDPKDIQDNGLLLNLIDDVFGLYDEETIVKSQEDTGFGFFDEDDTPLNSVSLEDDDQFGFFIDITQPSIQTKTESKNIVKVTEVVEVKENKKFKADTASNSIRVDLSKIDGLMNNIGELVIAHSMLTQYTSMMEDQKIKSEIGERLDLLDRYIRDLQESVMSVRMVPMETVFSKFPKVIRDTAKRLNKKIDFHHLGENVEIDKVMIEGLTDPLMHIVRNALDHGIESSEKRREAGKNETGTLMMSAEQANGLIMIKIQDDGNGIDLERVTTKAIENEVITQAQASTMTKEEKALLIFAPGLSTADSVTDISGRGVGMDVVMSNIKKLGGVVKVETEEGYGTSFIISLPLTLAILDGLNVRIGKEQFIMPLSAIIESLKPEDEMIKQIGDENSEVLMLRDEFIPIVRLHSFFNVVPEYQKLSDGLLIVVRSATQKIALFVDEFMDQQQFVIKPLDKNFRNAQGIGGATVRGDGTIGLIIDTMNIMENNY